MDLTEKLPVRIQGMNNVLCFGNYKKNYVGINTHKLGTSSIYNQIKNNNDLWYVDINFDDNEFSIESYIRENNEFQNEYNENQKKHIKKLILDEKTKFYFVMKEPNHLFLSSLIYCLNHVYDHRIHCKYHDNNLDLDLHIRNLFSKGKNDVPHQISQYLNSLIEKFPRDLFEDAHITPKYPRYLNFLKNCLKTYKKEMSDFNLLDINDIDIFLSDYLEAKITGKTKLNSVGKKTKDVFYNEILGGLQFDDTYGLTDLLLSSFYKQDVLSYDLLSTTCSLIRFDKKDS
jgi:hypothetical protein